MTDELDPTEVTEIVGDAAEEGPPAEAESEDEAVGSVVLP